MSTIPIFSKEYYTNSWMFNKDVNAVQAPNGGTVIQADFFTNPLKFRNTHAIVDSYGTITTVPFSFFDNVKRYFSLEQDQNLIAVHRRLKNLEEQIKDPLSREWQKIVQEVHKEGYRGAEILKSNIETLSSLFDKGNQKSTVTLTLLKVVNFIRGLLNWHPIGFSSFEPINRQLFEERVIKPALEELTLREQIHCNFNILIYTNSPFPPPPELTDYNVKRLEQGLLRTLNFAIDDKKFGLEYDREKKEFVLFYEGSSALNNFATASLVTTSLSNGSEPYYTHREDLPLPVVERKPDGTRFTKQLQFSYTNSYQPGTWYNLFHEVRRFVRTPGAMTLNLDSMYTIPLSQGDLRLTIIA